MMFILRAAGSKQKHFVGISFMACYSRYFASQKVGMNTPQRWQQQPSGTFCTFVRLNNFPYLQVAVVSICPLRIYRQKQISAFLLFWLWTLINWPSNFIIRGHILMKKIAYWNFVTSIFRLMHYFAEQPIRWSFSPTASTLIQPA